MTRWRHGARIPCGALLMLVLGTAWANAETRTPPLSHADMVKLATQQSASNHRIEALPGGGARLSSPLQAMEADARSGSITVRSTAKDEPGSFTLRPLDLGRAGSPTRIAAGKVIVEKETVRIVHPHVVEELTTSADGVRQDFLVAASPAGRGELRLVLEAHGAKLTRKGDAVSLTLASGRELLYRDLKVTDSIGTILPAHFAVTGKHRMHIAVDDRGARYPLRIDPTFTDADWIAIAAPATDGRVTALLLHDTDLYVGGEFTAIDGLIVNHIAKWNGSRWSALGDGMDYGVNALVWMGNSLYAGGYFSIPASRVARWDGSHWSAVGTVNSGTVNALATDGTNLYAGGNFQITNGTTIRYVAQWNGSGWSALGSGIVGTSVDALVWMNGSLYVGGSFSQAGGGAVTNIAKWSSGGGWSALGSMNGPVYALATDGTDLYVGGQFTNAGGSGARYIARLSGGTWHTVGSLTGSYVRALAWDSTYNRLYAGGFFSSAGAVSLNNVAMWDGGNWWAMGDGVQTTVNALVVDGATVVAGGNLTQAGGVEVNHIAKWSWNGGGAWSSMDQANRMNGEILALAWDGANLYAGGTFTHVPSIAANRVAKWNGSAWSALGSGTNQNVESLVWVGNTLYAAGSFTAAGGVPVNGVAKWDSGAWSAVGTPGDVAAPVLALATDGINIYAGGNFTTTDGAVGNYIAKWDGAEWTAMGNTLDGSVKALLWDGNRLYVGGPFTDYIASWSAGTWSSVGGGLNGQVNAFAWDGTHLYVGGWFTDNAANDGLNLNHVAQWNGTAWSPLGDGVTSGVLALAVDGADLYAGGIFTDASGTQDYIAKWDGLAWAPVGSGANGAVNALVHTGDHRLYAGGTFTSMAGAPSRLSCLGAACRPALGGGGGGAFGFAGLGLMALFTWRRRATVLTRRHTDSAGPAKPPISRFR